MKWNFREDSLESSLIFELQVFDEVVRVFLFCLCQEVEKYSGFGCEALLDFQVCWMLLVHKLHQELNSLLKEKEVNVKKQMGCKRSDSANNMIMWYTSM